MPISYLTRGFVGGISMAVQQVPITPTVGQAILVKALEYPMAGVASEALGVFQSDVILRTALVAALADIRANPYLLDYVFASLPRDEKTWKDYGEKSVQKAKDWFLKTDIPVSMVPRIDEGRWPRITISLADSQETENTLGDVHSVPVEYLTDFNWPIVAGPFTPTSYDPHTGVITLPSGFPTSKVAPGMYIIDKVGREHQIVSVDNDLNPSLLSGTIVDLRDSLLKGPKPTSAVHMESAAFKEVCHIGLHVGSEPVYLTWLHSIVTFALLRYRESLLEARGFERSALTSSDFIKNEAFGEELVFSRYITMTGTVRTYWPKHIVATVSGVEMSSIHINPAHNIPNTKDDVKLKDALWVGELDPDSDGIG